MAKIMTNWHGFCRFTDGLSSKTSKMEIVLNTYGASLSCENEAFVVRNHNGTQRIPTDGVNAILINKGASVTSDAVMLAVDKQIQIHFMDRKGMPVGLVWSYKYGSISTIRKHQIEFCNSQQGFLWMKSIIRRKIENEQALLYMVDCSDVTIERRRNSAVAKLDSFLAQLHAVDADSIQEVAPELRGIEGIAANVYFKTLNMVLPEQYRSAERSQHPALDVTNALLNYGYGILYGKVESALVRAGLDPYMGVLHRDDYNRPALAFDLIEVFRVWVDYVVYTLLAQRAVTVDYYSVADNGACWLEPMGRRVMIQSLNDYLDEVIESQWGQRSRDTIIFLTAQSLAQQIKGPNLTLNNPMQE